MNDIKETEFDRIDKSIDVIGAYSPCLEATVRDAVEKMQTNQVLQVLNTDKVAAEITIPYYCDRMGYPYELRQLDESMFEILIRKVEMK